MVYNQVIRVREIIYCFENSQELYRTSRECSINDLLGHCNIKQRVKEITILIFRE